MYARAWPEVLQSSCQITALHRVHGTTEGLEQLSYPYFDDFYEPAI